MSADTLKTISVKLDQETRDQIDYIAEVHRRTAHWIMREAIRQYVDREIKREAFRQSTLKAWNEYHETGLYASAEEVNHWLSSWGTDNELPAPVCHK